MANEAERREPTNEELRSEAFAAMGYFPNRSPCPVGCKFCYERSLPEFYPKLKVLRAKPKTPEQFDFYASLLDEYQQSAIPISPVTLDHDGMVLYTSNSDFFAQGLSLEQLDRVVAANAAAGKKPYVNTMGKGFDFETAKYLQERHPDTFRVRLSLLTYNDKIKADLIPKWEDSTDMRKITSILHDGNIYLLHFSVEQTLADLHEVNRLANREHKPKVGLALIHYTYKHSPAVQKYANDGFGDFPDLIRHLMTGKESFENITSIQLQHPSYAFAFRFRNPLRELLGPYVLREDDLVLCSKGAYPVMRDLVVRGGATVMPVSDGLGGSTTFTATMCTDDFVRELRTILAQPRDVPFRRVFVPDAVWWVGDEGRRTCLNAGTLDDVREAFPAVQFVMVKVPTDIIETTLDVRQAYDWFNADLEKTRDLALNRHDVLAACLAPHESLTELGYVRRFARADSDEAIDPTTLSTLEPEALVRVEYDELIVEREGLYPVEGTDTRHTIDMDGAPIFVRRARTRSYELPGRYMRSLFADLFLAKRPLEDVAKNALGDLPLRMYRALFDLERRSQVSRIKRRLPMAATP